ncbi:MAG: SH3 domain-containing protein, partial [Chloroflexi bacterium]|nr:SH3 domain-containing protein [Chloroflexota bacterium]
PAPTAAPIVGTTTSEVNVRADTSTASQSLGTAPAFSTVQVIGMDESGIWLKVIYNETTGWVRADLVQLAAASAEVPVVNAGSGAGSEVRGVILRGVNVRSEAGTEFKSLGLLSQNDVVAILGRDATGAWLKIAYPAAPEGTGWVASEYVQVENLEAVPVAGEAAQAEAETPIQLPLTAPPRTASNDGDNADAPIATLVLSAAGAKAFQVQGEVSAPEGDAEDWFAFSAERNTIVIEISCEPGAIQVELLQSTTPLFTLGCDEVKEIQIKPSEAYHLRVSPVLTEEPSFARYNLKIKIEP